MEEHFEKVQERCIEHTLQFFTLGIGAQVYYSEGIDKLVVNMGEVSPHFMTAVPRFYDSLHTRISQGLKNQGKLSQTLFAVTLRLGTVSYTHIRAHET